MVQCALTVFENIKQNKAVITQEIPNSIKQNDQPLINRIITNLYVGISAPPIIAMAP